MKSIFGLLHSIYERLTAGGSTEEQAVQSGIWVAGINVGERVLQLLKLIILARLLSPEAFGLLGIALLVITALRQFSQLGFDQALIQHQDDNVDAYLNTAWILNIARGFVIAVIAFLLAPYLAEFFDESQARPLIQVIGVTPLILGLQNPAVLYFQKSLNFHKEFAYQVGGALADFGVAVVIALIFRSVWALAAGIVAMNFVNFVLSYLLHEYRPSIEFNLEYGTEMFGFGKWILASAVLIFLYSEGDDAFVGWFFGATTLGFYQLAYQFSNAPATEVTHVISRVAFPAFSKIQNDVDRLREGYFRAVQLSSIVGFPMAAGLIAVAPQFVPTIFGSEWDPMIPLMQILSVWGAQRALGANVGAVFKAIGRPDYDTKLQIIKVSIIAILIYPAAERFGISGVAYVLIGNTLVVQPIGFYLVLSAIEGDIYRLLNIIGVPLVGSIIMAITVLGINVYLIPDSGLIGLFILIILGILCYGGLMLLSEKILDYEFTLLYRMFRESWS